MRKRVFLSLVIVLLVVAGATLSSPRWRARVIGLLRNDPYFDGLPLNYWISVADGDDAELRTQAIDILVEVSKQQNPKVSGQAFKALALVAPEKQLLGLIEHLKRESPNDWKWQEEGRSPRGSMFLGHAHTLEKYLDLAGREEFVPLLIDTLKYKDTSPYGNDVAIRETGTRFLAKIGPQAKAAVPALIVALEEDSSTKVRIKAAEALGAIGPEAKIAVPALVKALEDDDISLRESITFALKELAPETAGKVAAPMFIPALAKDLQDKDERVREGAAATLGRLRLAEELTVPVLVEALKDSSSLVRSAAAKSLGQFGPAAKSSVPALTNLLKDSTRIEAAIALWRIEPGNDLTLPVLRQELGSEYSSARLQAACALGNLVVDAKGEAATAVLPLLGDKNWLVREEAARSLGQFGQDAKLAIPALTQKLTDTEAYVRFSAALALWRIDRRGDLAFPVLRRGLKDRVFGLAAIAAFGDLGPEGKAEAVAALTPMLKSDDWQFRLAARYALKRIDPEAAAKAGVR